MTTTFSTCLPRALPRPPLSSMPRRRFLPPAFRIVQLRTSRTTVVCASAASFDELDAKGWARARSAKSVLSDLIQEIEPLDTSLIQKDVPAVTVDAMKRTISGMLGILPSDRFNVMVEALWERLFKLLVSSMMTGYTLRNAEFRLSIEKILEKMENHHNKEEHLEKDENKDISSNNPDKLQSSGRTSSRFQLTGRDALLFNSFKGEEVLASEDINYECLGELSPEAKECICNLKTRLSALEKDLHEVRRKNSALQMQQFVGEEKNDLLDYLRSLQPEKVIELSEPTSPEVHEIVHSIAHGLLATLSPKMHSKPPPESDGVPGGTMSVGEDDRTEMLENASLHLQPLIAVPRDYLARLLFWCLLLGHHLRGLEHRLELMQLLTVDGRT